MFYKQLYVHIILCSSMPHNKAGPVHAGDDAADVQDPGAERADPGVQPVSAVPGRHQVQRHAGHAAELAARLLLPLYITLQGN